LEEISELKVGRWSNSRGPCTVRNQGIPGRKELLRTKKNTRKKKRKKTGWKIEEGRSALSIKEKRAIHSSRKVNQGHLRAREKSTISQAEVEANESMYS